MLAALYLAVSKLLCQVAPSPRWETGHNGVWGAWQLPHYALWTSWPRNHGACCFARLETYATAVDGALTVLVHFLIEFLSVIPKHVGGGG